MKKFNELSYKKQCLIAEQLRALNNEEFLELANEFETYEQLNILNLENLWNELLNDYSKEGLIKLFLRSEIKKDHEYYCWKNNGIGEEFIKSCSRVVLEIEYVNNYSGFLSSLDKATNGKIKEIIEAKDENSFAFA